MYSGLCEDVDSDLDHAPNDVHSSADRDYGPIDMHVGADLDQAFEDWRWTPLQIVNLDWDWV